MEKEYWTHGEEQFLQKAMMCAEYINRKDMIFGVAAAVMAMAGADIPGELLKDNTAA